MRALPLLMTLLVGCASEPPPRPHEPPAHVECPVPESELAIVRFTPRAIERLGIETGTVEERDVPRVRVVGGEVAIPPGGTLSVAAPVGGLVRALPEGELPTPGAAVRSGDPLLHLIPIGTVERDLLSRAERDVAAAQAQLDATAARAGRIEQLVAERAGSARELEDAVLAREVARADLEAALARARTARATPLLTDAAMTVRAPGDGIVRALSVGPGQVVGAGAPLLEIVAVDALMVRVPVYAGDLAMLDASAPAMVRGLGREGASVAARPVLGPPTADPAGATVDRWYALAPGAPFAPGERVLSQLPLNGEERARVLPWASIVVDAEGASWVYACAGEHAFRRQRIDPIRRAGELAVFARGPAAGECVATVGAAEIFGSEFEPGH